MCLHVLPICAQETSILEGSIFIFHFQIYCRSGILVFSFLEKTFTFGNQTKQNCIKKFFKIQTKSLLWYTHKHDPKNALNESLWIGRIGPKRIGRKWNKTESFLKCAFDNIHWCVAKKISSCFIFIRFFQVFQVFHKYFNWIKYIFPPGIAYRINICF